MQGTKIPTREDIINYIRTNNFRMEQVNVPLQPGNDVMEESLPKTEAIKKVLEDPTESNWKDIIDSVLINEHSIIPDSHDAITRIESDSSQTRIIPSGSLVAFTGAAKSGKSKLACQITAASLQIGTYNGLFKSVIDKVLVIDSEQSVHDVKKTYETIFELLEDKNKISNLALYSLRKFTYKQRLFLLNKVMGESPEINLLVIDGIRDFVSDPNSAEEANLVVSLLLKWSTDLGIAIIVIIHQNKADLNLRGHLGTELMNKADCVISVEKKEDLFIVKPKVTRGREFSSFAFILDDQGVPRIDHSFIPGSKNKSEEDKCEVSDELHKEVLHLAYANVKDVLPGWSDLIKLLMDTFMKKSITKGDNTIRGFIAKYLASGWMDKVAVRGRSYKGYRLLLVQ